MIATNPQLFRERLAELPEGRRQAMAKILARSIRDAHKPEPRSRVEFASECIVIPGGKHKGSPWLPEFQPFAYHLLHLMDTSGYRRFAVTGCVQSGKTMVACIFSLLWHLFEQNHNVGFVVPELKMAAQKWEDQIKPVIDASPVLRQLAYGDASRTNVPQGKGSKGATVDVIRFANGCRLQFIGTTGNEARRAGFTLQVMIKDEVDRYDTAGDSAREASAAMTVEDRADSYDDDAYIYENCTMTTVNGRINKQVRGGTDHSVHYRCPHCRHYVRPKRDHFVGVEGCDDIKQAEESGTFICPRPSCAAVISQQQRVAMLEDGVVVASTQVAKIGTDGAALVEGDLKPTDTCSFWWNAFDNKFWKTKTLAKKEWTALYSDDLDDEDKQAKQKRWAEPVASTVLDVSKLTKATLISRVSELYKGVVPTGAAFLSLGADYRETQLHHVVRAWMLEETETSVKLTGHAIDIGWTPVERDKHGVHDATLIALRELRDRTMSGIYTDAAGKPYVPGWAGIDAGYKEQWLWEFSLECVGLGLQTWIPTIGRGQSDPNVPGSYRQPEKVDADGPNKKVYWLGDQCHLRKSSKHADVYAEAGCPLPPLYLLFNTDEGKAFLRDGYNAPPGSNGALGYFKPSDAAERDAVEDYRKQLLSEQERYTYVEGRGMVRKFTNKSRKLNHYLDADNICCFMAQLCGAPVSLTRRSKPVIVDTVDSNQHLTMPDGRPFMAGQPIT